MKRRDFLSISAGGVGAVLLSQCNPMSSSPVHSTATQKGLSAVTDLPTVYTSTDGLLELDLEASYRMIALNGKPASLMAYNGQVPGPRLEAKPGDTVRIRFTNNLPEPTNIHYHGLNISHIGNGDNVFLSIEPGETFNYEFTLPEDHPAGTFWYHPHRHGFVANQVFAGLSGFFIVRGDLDEIPEVKAASEAFLALKDFQLDTEGRMVSPNHMAVMMGREGALLTASGQMNPSLSIPESGLLRLRLLNASVSRFYRLQVEQHSMHLMATDGGVLAEPFPGKIAAPVEIQELLLTPGERAEVLIRGNQRPGSYGLLNLPYNRGGMGMMGGGMRGGGMHRRGEGHSMRGIETSSAKEAAIAEALPLATVRYLTGFTEAVGLPPQLISTAALPAAENARRIELSTQRSFMQGMAFTLNGKTFSKDRIDIQVPIGTTEEWEIANVDTHRMDHPFHLHAAAFQVISRDGQPEAYPAWKDTVLIRGGETVRIRIHFKDFPGKSVYHCHILDHEELGMMGVIKVQA